ncbi:MAG TPA: DUF2281 domain-containing protein [Pyrinomonadaceae bacterium]|nr:DUF2281 domain-containing protein [Pyrinomonadaceae bacterium]
MTSEEVIFAKVKGFPPNLKEEALHFIEFLETKLATKPKRQISLGIGEDLGIEITSADIDEARKEMWANFPREEFYGKEQK